MKYLNFFVILLTLQSEARVFNLTESKLAGYLSANYSASTVGKDFFIGESSSTEFSKGFTQNIGTDFGLVYRADKIAWIFGFESIKPNKISGGVSSTAGTQNYKYTSDLSVLAPKIGLELILYQAPKVRVSLHGSVGTASLQTKTDYTNLTIAPNVDFTIEGKSTTNMISSGIGTEWHWADNTAIQLFFGYREMNFSKLKAATAATDSFQGPIAKGATLTKLDGSNVKYNFSGLIAGLVMRIWIF